MAAVTNEGYLFDRHCRLVIANPVTTENDFKNFDTTNIIEILAGSGTGHRVQFDVSKTLKKEPNNCTITVSNLAPTTRKSLQKKGVKVFLEVGYAQTGLTKIFQGDARDIDHKHVGSDWETVFHLGDGARSFKYAVIEESFAPNTTVANVLRRLAENMGLDLGNVESQLADVRAKFDHGYTASGSSSDAFDKLVKSIGKTWSVQDGKIQLLGKTDTLDVPIPLVSPRTGLIESPEMGTPPKKGKPALLSFKSLIIGGIRPGGKVQIESERYNGFVRLESCKYSGDTFGGPWYVSMTGSIISSS